MNDLRDRASLLDYVADATFEGITLFELIEQAEMTGDDEFAAVLVALLPDAPPVVVVDETDAVPF